jgi:phosphoribosylanthranilate isomerase
VILVKICGLTRAEDVRQAVGLGASYVGFNFSASSPRRVDDREASSLAGAAEGARRVGVFVGEDAERVSRAIEAAHLELLQFHRRLREEDFAFGLPVIGVCPVSGESVDWPDPRLLPRCHALLFDTSVPGPPGGTGRTFAWSLAAARELPVPRWIAGGLTPENVGEAVGCARPALVDAASGVETSPGVKDWEKMRRFFEAVKRADDGR